MESMIIENCPICGKPSHIVMDVRGLFYVESQCSDAAIGPSCKTELDAIRFFNAMMRGLKSEMTK